MNDKLDKIIDTLKTERDELKVRAHLLKAEAKDEWQKLESEWDNLDLKLGHLKEGAKESAEDIGAAASQLAGEIGAAYKRIKKSLD